MRHARRIITTLIGLATWWVASATVAFAQLRPDPLGGAGVSPPPPLHPAAETSAWKLVVVAAIVALLAIALVSLVASLRHARLSRPSRMLYS
jgi:hypothetical protein